MAKFTPKTHFPMARLKYIVALLQVLRWEYQKFRILEILNFHPCTYNYYVKFQIIPLFLLIEDSETFETATACVI